MPNVIPPELQQSLGVQYIASKGFNFEPASDNQIKVEICPLCKHDNWHFFMCHAGTKDGLWMCHRCGKTGNLITLQEQLGDKIVGVESRGEWGAQKKKIDPLPDVNAAHEALLGNADAMDYLLNVRGFSPEIIEQKQLGFLASHWFKSCGEVPAIVIPYLVGQNCVFAKYRTYAPNPKDFSSPTGWDVPLYNGEILKSGLREIIFVEGEYDALALMSHGIMNVVGVPGAAMKKATWITELDEVAPDNIYILYDNDGAGSKGAQELAQRIGIERCLKIVIPPTEYQTDDGPKKCKDINDFFVHGGGTVEAFEELKKNAKQFDVSGVSGTGDTLSELQNELQGKDSLMPTYSTPWPSLNTKVGFENGDVIDLIAEAKVGKSTLALNLLEYVVKTYDENALFICLEMTRLRLARKWVSHVTQTDDSVPKTIEEGKVRLEAMLRAVEEARKIAANRTSDLYFCYPQVSEPEDVYNLIRQCYRRYGIKWVVLDNLQLLCDMTLKNQGHRTTHLSTISKSLMRLNKDLNMKMIRILQPHQIKEGNIIGVRNTDGSSQISKDCDCHIMLHRNPVGDTKASTFEAAGIINTDTAMDPRMLVTVGLSRYSSGGSCTLEFVGGTSTVREYSTEAAAAIPRNDSSVIKSKETVKPLMVLPSAPKPAPVSSTPASEEITI